MTPAPRCFAMIMDVLVRHWHASGIRVLGHLDDWLFVQAQDAARVTARVLADYKATRIATNYEKSQLSPDQRVSSPI